MNWKKQFDKPKPGDTVIMFKPCISCNINTPRSEKEKEICWRSAYKDVVLTVRADIPTGKHIEQNKIPVKASNNNWCWVERECLRKV